MNLNLSWHYLFRCCHKVDGSVVAVIFLKQTEGKLVIDQQVIWSTERQTEAQNTNEKSCEQADLLAVEHF